jgi:hypothetical protein
MQILPKAEFAAVDFGSGCYLRRTASQMMLPKMALGRCSAYILHGGPVHDSRRYRR